MTWTYSGYLLPLLFTAILCGTCAALVWPLRRASGARALFFLLLSAGAWGLNEFIQYGTQDFTPKLYLDMLVYTWAGLTPVLWLIFCLQYSHLRGRLRSSEVLSLLVIPIIAVLWTFIDPYGGAARTVGGLVSASGVLHIERTFGPVLWTMIVYVNILMAIGTVILLRYSKRSGRVSRYQTAVLALAALTPWVVNAVYLITGYRFFPVDPTVVGMGIAAALLVVAVRNMALFDLAPAGRDAAIQAMKDGWFVIDPADRIVDLNPSARHILERDGLVSSRLAELTGRRMSILVPAFSPSLRAQMPPATQAEPVTLGHGSQAHQYRVQQSEIRDRYDAPAGTVLTLHDVTQELARQREREELVTALTSALADVHQLSGLLPICASCKKIRDDGGYWTQLEEYLSKHSEATFTHGLCPDCARRLMEQAEDQEIQRANREAASRRSQSVTTDPDA